MKKNLLAILLLITSIISFGQARLGYSAKELLSEFSDSKYNLEKEYSDGELSFYLDSYRAKVIHSFDSRNICTSSLIVPRSKEDLDYYVNLYNEKFIISSETSWKVQNNNGTAFIVLALDDNKNPYFMWFTLSR